MISVKPNILQREAEAFFQAEADLRTGLQTLAAADIAAALVTFHKQLGATRPTNEQYRELVAQFAQVLQAQPKAPATGATGNGIVVRAACRAGLLTGLSEEAVGDLTPGAVLKLATQVSEALRQAFEIDPE